MAASSSMIKIEPGAAVSALNGRRVRTAASPIKTSCLDAYVHRGSNSAVHHRKLEVKCSAISGRTLHPDFARVLLNDSVGYGESESGAATIFPGARLRREEGIVNSSNVFLRDASAGVGDFNVNSASVICLNAQSTALRHGIFGVQEQVQEDLL